MERVVLWVPDARHGRLAVHYTMKWLTLDEPNGRYECIGPNGAMMSCASGEAANRNAAALYALLLVGVFCCIRDLRKEVRNAKETVERVNTELS